jgi:hypothetical protein
MTERCSLLGSGEIITPWTVFTAGTRAALLTPRPTPFILKASGMAAFSVFFCDQERCSIQPVRAMDSDHAIAQVRRKCLIYAGWRWFPMSCWTALTYSNCCRSGARFRF